MTDDTQAAREEELVASLRRGESDALARFLTVKQPQLMAFIDRRLGAALRRKVEPEDLSGNLVVQLGVATEDLNRCWYQANTGQVLRDVQRQIRHPALRWMAAIEATGAVFEAKFMLPWSFSEEAAAEKYRR